MGARGKPFRPMRGKPAPAPARSSLHVIPKAGDTFGRLTVLGEVFTNDQGYEVVPATCNCWAETRLTLRVTKFVPGAELHCGCWAWERTEKPIHPNDHALRGKPRRGATSVIPSGMRRGEDW